MLKYEEVHIEKLKFHISKEQINSTDANIKIPTSIKQIFIPKKCL